MPALHDAVLDDELHARLAGAIDQRTEDTLGLAQVVGHRPGGIAAHEGADGGAADQGRGVDAPGDVLVDRRPLGAVRVEVVVVERDRRELETVLGEQLAGGVGLGVPKRSTARWVAVKGRSPRSGRADLQRLVALGRGPLAELGSVRRGRQAVMNPSFMGRLPSGWCGSSAGRRR